MWWHNVQNLLVIRNKNIIVYSYKNRETGISPKTNPNRKLKISIRYINLRNSWLINSLNLRPSSTWYSLRVDLFLYNVQFVHVNKFACCMPCCFWRKMHRCAVFEEQNNRYRSDIHKWSYSQCHSFTYRMYL